MSAPVDTTRKEPQRVPMVGVGGVVHLATPSWALRCHEVRMIEQRRFYGSIAALTCTRCRRAFEKERRG